MLLTRALRAAALLVTPPAVVALALLASLGATAQDKGARVRVRWFGQACFELTFPGGLVVLTDPFGPGIGSYRFPRDVTPEIVTISHEHGDHNNDKDVAGKPQVLRGLTAAEKEKQDWNKHDLVVKGVHIRSVGVFHDEKSGAERGKNTIFVFEPERPGAFAKIVHLGDLGHTLTDEQKRAVGEADVVLTPVGGQFTIDATGAKKVCEQLAPAWVVPMHYKTPALEPELPLATADAFIELFKGVGVNRVPGNAWDATPKPRGAKRAPEAQLVVLGYEPADAKKEDAVAASVKISEARAWINEQGPSGRAIFYSFTVTADGGPAGAKLTLRGQVSVPVTDHVPAKLEGADFEDDSGKPQPAGGWTLGAGEKKTLHVVASEKGAPVPGERPRVAFVAELAPAKGGKPMTDTASPAIQDVR